MNAIESYFKEQQKRDEEFWIACEKQRVDILQELKDCPALLGELSPNDEDINDAWAVVTLLGTGPSRSYEAYIRAYTLVEKLVAKEAKHRALGHHESI